MALIPLIEYGRRHGKERHTVFKKYQRGGFKTAQKIGRDILIDEDEPYIDARVKNGKYVGWRYGYQYNKALRARKAAAAAAEAAQQETPQE